MADQRIDSDAQSADVRDALVQILVESWRFVDGYERAALQQDSDRRQRYLSRSRYFRERLETIAAGAGLRIAPPKVGELFDGGLPSTPLNAEDFAPNSHVVVDQIVEPTIVWLDGKIAHAGSLLLREVTA